MPSHDTFVDGRAEAPLQSVRPDGRIVFEFDLIEDSFAWIEAALIKASPVKTGRYSKSHLFLADGVAVDPAASPTAAEYAFINSVPYSRKIERGLSPQAPEGVYEAVATLAARRFGNFARVRYGFRSLLLDYVPGGANRAERRALKNQPARLSAMRLERATRQPAIIITPR